MGVPLPGSGIGYAMDSEMKIMMASERRRIFRRDESNLSRRGV